MSKTTRKYIHLISRHSNWSKRGVHSALENGFYNDASAWRKFLEKLFMAMGVAFMTAGILFFFAYNWADLHKFAKLGLLAALVIVVISIVLFTPIKENIKDILLTGASVLIGVLFAVFGQIYQTGANAYDLFLGWTLAITLWVVVGNFAPLWLVWITLINITVFAYAHQVAENWSNIFIYGLLFIINSGFLVLALTGAKFIEHFKVNKWLTHLLAMVAVSQTTWAISRGIGRKHPPEFWLLILITTLLYILGYWYGLKYRSGIYMAIIPLSVVVILSVLLINISDSAGMFLVLSLFVIASITLVVKNLIHHQKLWDHE